MANTEMICTACGSRGRTKSSTPGSIFIEILLWLMFIVPGLVYSIWRLTKRHKVCAACGSAALVPVSSPIGQRLVGAA